MSSEMVTCPSCGNQVPAASRFCPECGYNLASFAQATGQLPPLTPGTPTQELGSLSDEEREELAASQGWPVQSSQPQQLGGSQQLGQTPAPAMGAMGDQGFGQPQGVSEQPRGGSLVPIPQNELAFPPPPTYRDSQMSQSLQPTELNPAGPIQTYPMFSQPAPTTYGSYQVDVDDRPPRNPLMGFLLELIGYIGLLGIGHMYSGHIPRGIVLTLAWILYGVIVLIFVLPASAAITFCTLGTVQCFAYPFYAIYFIMPILSGFWVHNDLDAEVKRRNRRSQI